MLSRRGTEGRAAFRAAVYSDDFSAGGVENLRGTYGHHSPERVQFVGRGGGRLLSVAWPWSARGAAGQDRCTTPQQGETESNDKVKYIPCPPFFATSYTFSLTLAYLIAYSTACGFFPSTSY